MMVIMACSEAQFIEEYGGTVEWENAEERFDGDEVFTKADFLEHYNGLEEWNSAPRIAYRDEDGNPIKDPPLSKNVSSGKNEEEKQSTNDTKTTVNSIEGEKKKKKKKKKAKAKHHDAATRFSQ